MNMAYIGVSKINTGIVLLLALQVRIIASAGGDILPYHVMVGFNIENTHTSQMQTDSMIQCALHNTGDTGFPLATYKKASRECNSISEMPQNIFLRQTYDDNDVVLWGEEGCPDLVNVFLQHNDMNMDGSNAPVDYTVQSSAEDCISHCNQTFPAYQGVVFNKGSGGWCQCKDDTVAASIYGQTDCYYYMRLPDYLINCVGLI